MAQFDKVFQKLINHEGGYVNNPSDRGGPTKYGVTLATWIAQGYDKNKNGKIDKEDVKMISVADAQRIAKINYWDSVKGDFITSQSVAEIIFDWGYMSGTKNVIRRVQRLIGVTADGVPGPMTVTAINKQNPKVLFEKIKKARATFFDAIVRNNPSQKVFLKGWHARNNSFKFND